MLLHIDIHKLMKIIEKYFILDKRNKIFITIFLLILTMMLHFFIALHEIYSNYNFLGWIILLILFLYVYSKIDININKMNPASHEKVTDESGHSYILDQSPKQISLLPFIILGVLSIILYFLNMNRIGNNICEILLLLLSGSITSILLYFLYYKALPCILSKITKQKMINSGNFVNLNHKSDDFGVILPVKTYKYNKILLNFLFSVILYCVFVFLLIFFNEIIPRDIEIRKEFSTLYILFGGFLGAEIMNFYSQR